MEPCFKTKLNFLKSPVKLPAPFPGEKDVPTKRIIQPEGKAQRDSPSPRPGSTQGYSIAKGRGSLRHAQTPCRRLSVWDMRTHRTIVSWSTGSPLKSPSAEVNSLVRGVTMVRKSFEVCTANANTVPVLSRDRRVLAATPLNPSRATGVNGPSSVGQ